MILDFKLEIRKITFLLVMRIKKKRVKFCKDNQKTYRKLIIFSDEFWIFASQNRPRYMWEKDGKQVENNNTETKNKWFQGKKVLIWGAIAFDGHKVLYFVQSKTIDSNYYIKILESNLRKIEGL